MPNFLRTCACMALSALIVAACAGEGIDPSGSTSTTSSKGPSLLGQIQTDILQPTCARSGCHDPLTKSLGVDLSSAEASYDSLVGVPATCNGAIRVVPDDPDASYLLDKLGTGGTFCGSMMPLGGPSLDGAQLQLIRDWIAAGALPANAPRSGDATTTTSSTSSTTSFDSTTTSTGSTSSTTIGVQN